MAAIDQAAVTACLDAAQAAATSAAKGSAFEDLVCCLFDQVPGITMTKRDVLNPFESEEVDIVFWNELDPAGLSFLPQILLVECKNWSAAVGTIDVSWFDTKLKNRGLPFGILVAANGITGKAAELTAARKVISDALREKRQIIVVTLNELRMIESTEGLAHLFKEKLCELAASGTLILSQ